jgi:hypothetical protein
MSSSTRFLSRLRRSATKIKSAANSKAARAMIHEMATTPVPGQISNTRPTTVTIAPIVVIGPRSVSSTFARQAARMWLTPMKSAQPRKTMSRVRADTLGQKKENPAGDEAHDSLQNVGAAGRCP